LGVEGAWGRDYDLPDQLVDATGGG
jgi:hypothetical protein